MKAPGFALLLAITALTPSGVLAQATPTPPPQSPAQQEGAPALPGLVTTPPQPTAPAPAEAAAPAPAAPQQAAAPPPAPPQQAVAPPLGPANICRELVAFLEAQAKALSAPPPAPAAGAAPAAPAAPPKPLPMPVEEAQGLAGANDIPGCRDASQRLRRAGVALPPGLIALAALKLELLQTAAQ